MWETTPSASNMWSFKTGGFSVEVQLIQIMKRNILKWSHFSQMRQTYIVRQIFQDEISLISSKLKKKLFQPKQTDGDFMFLFVFFIYLYFMIQFKNNHWYILKRFYEKNNNKINHTVKMFLKSSSRKYWGTEAKDFIIYRKDLFNTIMHIAWNIK